MNYKVEHDKNKPFDKKLPDGTIIHREQTAIVTFLDDDGKKIKTEEYGLFEASEVLQLVEANKDISLDWCFVDDLDLSDCIIKTFSAQNAFFDTYITFQDAIFSDIAIFEGATFCDIAIFGGATFRAEVNFSNVTFYDGSYFGSISFNKQVDFSYAKFSVDQPSSCFINTIFNHTIFKEESNFHQASFCSGTDFESATFRKLANFKSATFRQLANFKSATFSEANFESATFRKLANFNSATFRKLAFFNSATFRKLAFFNSATFRKLAFFEYATFSEANFESASFNKMANFKFATFRKLANFNSATFRKLANFEFATFSEANFESASFNKMANFKFATFRKLANFKFATFRKLANFKFATFRQRANFKYATFSAANFESATFSVASFGDSTFSITANFKFAAFKKQAFFDFSIFSDTVIFAATRFGDSISFELTIFKKLVLFQYITFNYPIYLIGAQCNLLYFDYCTFEKALDMREVKLNILLLKDTDNFGHIYIEWQKSNVKKAIQNYSNDKIKGYHWNRATQFRMLKENFRSLGQYDDEDAAYVAYRREEAWSKWHGEGISSRYRKTWYKITTLLRWLFKDMLGVYGTSPIRIFFSLIIIIVLFCFLYAYLGLELSPELQLKLHMSKLTESKIIPAWIFQLLPFCGIGIENFAYWIGLFYFSAITSFTVGYGDIAASNPDVAIASAIQAFIGVALMSYFVVAFSHKVLR